MSKHQKTATIPPPPTRFPWAWVVPLAGIGVLVGVLIVVGMRRGRNDGPPGMVLIPGGVFVMGRNDGAPDESPAHQVSISPFYMDKTEVTNAQFAEFVEATGYVTVAERKPDPAKFPGADPANLVPGSAVFAHVDASLDRRDWGMPFPPWWRYVPGACWRAPRGKGTNIRGKDDYPVVQIAWEDADAYAKWAGKRLPTEAEWEYAARGGLDHKEYCWGDAKPGDGGKWYANAFQGKFPKEDAGLDGFKGLAPVGQFPANGYGLYDMSGNAWEWCQDWYDPGYYAVAPMSNPQGPVIGAKGVEGEAEPQRVRRGGSFLCDDNYCRRYLPSARDKNPADSSANHTGFRCVQDMK